MDQEQLLAIVDRIVSGDYSEADIEVLRQALSNERERSLLQLGKYNINIREGKEGIHIGDRTYIEINDEAVQAIAKSIQDDVLSSASGEPWSSTVCRS